MYNDGSVNEKVLMGQRLQPNPKMLNGKCVQCGSCMYSSGMSCQILPDAR